MESCITEHLLDCFVFAMSWVQQISSWFFLSYIFNRFLDLLFKFWPALLVFSITVCVFCYLQTFSLCLYILLNCVFFWVCICVSSSSGLPSLSSLRFHSSSQDFLCITASSVVIPSLDIASYRVYITFFLSLLWEFSISFRSLFFLRRFNFSSLFFPWNIVQTWGRLHESTNSSLPAKVLRISFKFPANKHPFQFFHIILLIIRPSICFSLLHYKSS